MCNTFWIYVAWRWSDDKYLWALWRWFERFQHTRYLSCSIDILISCPWPLFELPWSNSSVVSLHGAGAAAYGQQGLPFFSIPCILLRAVGFKFNNLFLDIGSDNTWYWQQGIGNLWCNIGWLNPIMLFWNSHSF